MYAAHCLDRDYARALEVAPYGDEGVVRRQTEAMVGAGASIFQTHKLASTDREHVAVLLRCFSPPCRARVLDAGCGVGAVARLMAEMRPDLRFTLLNISGAQLDMVPAGMAKVRADFHHVPMRDGCFDAVMFTFSLGHGLLDRCLAEAARVLRPGGVLFIYDIAGDQEHLITHAGYRPHGRDEVTEAAARHGFSLDLVRVPPSSTADCVALFGRGAFEAHGFDRVWPMIYRFVK